MAFLLHDRPFRTAAVLKAAALFFVLTAAALPTLARAQTVPCTGPIGGVCVPIIPFTAGGTSGGYPSSSTPVQGNATGSTGAVVGTLAGVAGKTTYICGFAVSAVGSGAVGPITIAGLVTSSQVYQFTAAATGGALTQAFTPCIPASAANTAITTTTTADGTATAVDVNSWGFQL
jgi:hypothetical protein